MKKEQMTDKDKQDGKAVPERSRKQSQQQRPESFIISFKNYLKRDRKDDAGK
jgi:hypothetical protein